MASDGEREAFRDLCSLGLHDTLRIHHKEGELFQLVGLSNARLRKKNRGLRIDAVLTTESLAKKKCIASGIDRENACWKRSFRSRSGVGRVCDLRTLMPNKSHLHVFESAAKAAADLGRRLRFFASYGSSAGAE